MHRRPFPEDDEQPWSEEEWLADMKRSAARADRFGELLETLRDEPDRDARLAREMGWETLGDALADDADAEGEPDFAQDFDISEFAPDDDDDDDEGNEDDDDDDDDDVDSMIEGRETREPDAVRHPAPDELLAGVEEDEEDKETPEMRKLFGREPARDVAEYQFACRIGMKLHRKLQRYAGRDADEDPTDGKLGEALIGPHIASAKIVGGHSLGYGKHYINGNIACQRIGLDAVDKSIAAYEILKSDGHLSAKLVDSILPHVRRLREALAARIERMRAYARTLHEQ